MQFSKFDMTILVVMTLSVIIMSFTLPAVGMAGSGNQTVQSDVPEFGIESDRFDLAGSFPDRPGGSQSGKITWAESYGDAQNGLSFIQLDAPLDNGFSIEIAEFGTSPDEYYLVQAANWSGGSIDSYNRYNITSEGQEFIYANNSDEWAVEFEVTEADNVSSANSSKNTNITVNYDVQSSGKTSQNSAGGLGALPVVGGLFQAGAELASTIVWIGEVILWGAVFIVELGVNLIGILFDTMVFAIDLMSYMVSTYQDVIAQSSDWARVVLIVPGMILFAEFAKLAMIAISLLPTT